MKSLLLAVSLVLSSSVALAKADFEHKPVAFDPAVFQEQRGKLVEQITRGSGYAELGEENAEKVIKALDEMGALLANVKSIEELDEKTRVEVFNRQELVNTLLTQAAEDSRLICARETTTGSHRRSTVCKTVAQRRIERDRSQDTVRRISTGANALPTEGGGR